MAESTPVLTPEPSGDALVYRPVSGLAIAGLAVALVYAGMVILSAGAALIQGAPFFWGPWAVLLALTGAGLSVAAQRHIRRSEGTRAGLKVAQWGLWLSVIAGLGYTTYVMATAAAVKQQANRFLMEAGDDMGFFPLLDKGEVNAAFLLTQPFSRRRDVNPRDDDRMRTQFDVGTPNNPTGWMTHFTDSPLVHLFEQARLAKETVAVEPAAVRGWSYEKGYKVGRVYRLSVGTPEPDVTADVVIAVQSEEGGGTGVGRKWFVDWRETHIVNTQEAPAGQKMRNLCWNARGFLNDWLDKLNQGQRTAACLETLEPAQRAAAASKWWFFPATSPAASAAGLPLALLAAAAPAHSALSRGLFLPEYDRFVRGESYVRAGGLRGPLTREVQAKIRADFEQAFQQVGITRPSLKLSVEDPKSALWELTPNGRLQVAQRFHMPLLQGAPTEQAFLGRGRILVETPVPGDPRQVPCTPVWRVVSVSLDRAVPFSGPQRPGQ